MRSLIIPLAIFSASAAWAICPLTDGFSSAVGAAVASGDTTGGVSDYSTSCGDGGGSADTQIEYTATSAGTYTFDTIGSAYDTVLAAFSTADCVTELACNDDFSGVQSQISLVLSAGETVVINVDGYSVGSTGAWVLNVAYGPPATCGPDVVLGGALGIVATGDTCGAINDHDGASCAAGQGSEDVTFLWTAPTTDNFTVDTIGSGYDTALTIRDLGCGELFCDDDGAGFPLSSISFSATAGSQYLIVVDGWSSAACGPFQLNIADCPDGDGDGICDADDICLGDDASGDSDADGICDDLDFTLAAGTPTRGAALTLTADNAEPASRVYFLLSTRGPGAGPCHPTAGICAGILGPLTVLGQRTADAAGDASLTLTVPLAAPAGAMVAFQAVYVGAAADTSEVEIRTVQ